eukprot:gene26861-33507_t
MARKLKNLCGSAPLLLVDMRTTSLTFSRGYVGYLPSDKSIYVVFRGSESTRHSLGAALAQLTSMDLIKAGIATSVYNFGQPRTGDQKYAAFANSKVSTWRVTHNKDMVPHLPFTTQMEFFHVCREQFENEAGALKTCDTSCEDPTCADQFDFKVTNFDDHVVYLGMSVSCEAVSAV